MNCDGIKRSRIKSSRNRSGTQIDLYSPLAFSVIIKDREVDASASNI